MDERAVIEVIRKIFLFYGYRVNRSEISDLLAEKDSERLFIKYEPSTNVTSVKHFMAKVQKNDGEGLLISSSFTEKTRMFALDEGLALWNRSDLESWVGRAVLTGALGEYLERIPKTGEEPRFVTFQAPEEPVKEDYERSIKLSLPSLPINIGKADALTIAREKISMIRSQKLKFIPVWYYHFSFSTQKKYLSRTVDLSGDGEGYLDAITGENFLIKFKDILNNIFVPTQNYEILEPLIERNLAITKATSAISRKYTKEVRINEMVGDTIVFEHKLFAPDPKEIQLEMDLIHIPVWEVMGRSRVLEINGYNGQIAERAPSKVYEKLKGSKSIVPVDDAEFV